MRIGELARATGLSTKTLRFYEQSGLLPEPHRTRSGYRDYSANALPRLRFIRSAQGAGLTLSEIGRIITVREDCGPPCAHVEALLDRHARDLDQRIADLRTLRTEVERLRTRAGTLDPAACGADAVCHVIG